MVWTGTEPEQTAQINRVFVMGEVTKSGDFIMVKRFIALSASCELQALPTASITQIPAHGTATVEATEDYPTFTPTSPLAACNGNRVLMLRLNYQSGQGFHAVDFFTVRADGAGKAEGISR